MLSCCRFFAAKVRLDRSFLALTLGLAFLIVLWQSLAGQVAGGDWPQILGPRRDGHAVDERLSSVWEESPAIVWQYSLGQGYAGPAVVGSTVYVFHRVQAAERLEALNANDGTRRWQVDFPASYSGGVDSDLGPRCVPVVQDGQVLVFGAAGMASSVNVETGGVRWQRDLAEDYRTQDGYFGAGSTPLIIDGKAIFNLGGTPQAGVIAVSLETGETVWTSTNDAASYSSPVVLSSEPRPTIAMITRSHARLINADDGQVRSEYPFGMRGPTVNAASPVLVGDRLLLTASYGIGAALVGPLTDSGRSSTLMAVWAGDEMISSQYNTPILLGEYLYGVHGREDVGVAELRCVKASNGAVRWRQQGFGTAHLLAVDGKLLALTANGDLVLLSPNPDRFSEVARFRLTPNATRALPAFSRGRLFARDNRGDSGRLICVQLP